LSGITYGLPQKIAELKASDDGWEVAGYASTWDRDLGGDVVHPGAFKSTLEAGGRVRFLYAHDAAQVLGRPLELYEDERGLFGRFRISKTRLGQDVHTLLSDGSLDSFSIGFIAKDFDHDEKANVRNLKAVELLEVSVVALPMQPRATVTAVKDREDLPAGVPAAPPPEARPGQQARLSLVEAHLRRVRINAGRRAHGLEPIAWPHP
jgi:Escherichia/Staphylococcus phage prohead protease